MSYRITEAARNHVAVIEDLNFRLFVNPKNQKQLLLSLEDGDKLNLNIPLPGFSLYYDFETNKLTMDDRINGILLESVVPGWKYKIDYVKDEDYLSRIKLIQENDNIEYEIDLTKLAQIITKELEVNGNTFIDGVLNVTGDVVIQNSLNVEGSITGQSLEITNDLTVQTLDVNGHAVINSLEVETETTTDTLLVKHVMTAQGDINVSGDVISGGDVIATNGSFVGDVIVNGNVSSGSLTTNELILNGETISSDINKQSDWNQIDENSKDFIKNKPDFSSQIQELRENLSNLSPENVSSIVEFNDKINEFESKIDDLETEINVIKSIKKYSVTYDINGGDENSCPESFITFSNVIVVSSMIPVRSNGTFLGWSLNQESNYSPNEMVVLSGDITLYAIWEIGELQYRLINNDTEYEVSGIGTVTDNDIIVPPTYNGLPVTRIGLGAFNGRFNLTSIDCPNVTIICDQAFYKCYNLTSINCPNVTYIGDSTFGECYNLTSINCPNVTYIGNSTFYQCSSLTSINCPNVTNIGNSTFFECVSLTSIDLQNVTIIGEFVVAGWTDTQIIYVPWSQGNRPSEWDVNWNECCGAIIKYWNGTEYV